jgi:hypothetical protein
MGNRARTDTLVAELVTLAIPTLQEAERQSPRTGPGAKPKTTDWVMAALIMIAVLNKKKRKSAQYRFLQGQRDRIAAWLGCADFPARATYFRRYHRAHRLYRDAVRLQGTQAIAEGVADPRHVAVDKSLIAAAGPPWHVHDRQAGKTPAGVDKGAAWGYSEYRGWVYGFSYEMVVTATPGTTVFPLLASADVASVSEPRTFLPKIDDLPTQTQTVSADSGYDANYVGEKVERDTEGKRTGRRFLCPENPRNSGRSKTKRGGADASRAESRELRRQRKRFLESERGQRIYARRKQTAEPFNQWFKSLFELEGRVWHRGLDNNRTQILAATFVYQLLVRYNHRCGNDNGRISWILDTV